MFTSSATHVHAPGEHPNALRRTGYGSDNGVFYLLQDHLKSSSAVINQNGTLSSQNYYYPFGGNRGSAFSTLTTKRFTGQYHEAGLPGGDGLSYYNARWYDAQLGRFISADPIVPDPTNPHHLNRYAYGVDNPLRYNDPTGHIIWDVVDAVFWLWSARDFAKEPSWSNAGWLALDTLSLLPLVPSQGWFRRGSEVVLDLTSKAWRRSNDIEQLVNIVRKSIPKSRTLYEISARSLDTINKYGIKTY